MDVDGDKPESVVNLTGNRRAVFWAAWACFFAGTAWLGGLVTGLVSPGVPLTRCHSSTGRAAWLWGLFRMYPAYVVQLCRA